MCCSMTMMTTYQTKRVCKIVKNKRLGRVWEFSKTLGNGKLSKKRGWPSVHPVTLELGNGLFMMGKPDKVKTKLHLMKEEHLRFWSDSFCGTGNLHLSYYAHTLNLSQVCFSLFNMPLMSITACIEQKLRVIMTTRLEDFLFSRFVIGTGNYSKHGGKACNVLCVDDRRKTKQRNASHLLY